MAIKKIIDIEVNDEKFLRFMDAFSEFDEAMSRTPEKTKRLEGVFSSLNHDVGRLGRQSVKFFRNMGSEASRIGSVFRSLNLSQILFTSEIGRTSVAMRALGAVANSVLETIKKISTIAGISIVGGVGVAGLLSRMSNDVIRQRFSARSLGLETGNVKAFEASHGSIFGGEEGANSFLSTAAKSQATPEGIAMLSGLGISANQRADEIANQLLSRLNTEFRRLTGSGATQFQALQSLHARTLGTVPIEQIRAIGNAKPEEIKLAGEKEKEFVSKTAISDQSAEKWATFWTGITGTLSQVQNNLLSVLSQGKMLSAIQGAITSAGNTLVEWIKGDVVRQAMEKFGKFIADTVDYLRSQKFADAVKEFIDSIISLADKIKAVKSFFSWGNNKKNKELNQARHADGKTNISAGHSMEHAPEPEKKEPDINLFDSNDLDKKLKEGGYLTKPIPDNLHPIKESPEAQRLLEEGRLINNYNAPLTQLPQPLNNAKLSSYFPDGSGEFNKKYEKLNMEPLTNEEIRLKQSISDFAKPSFNETNLGKTAEQFPLPTEETPKNPISEAAIYWAVYRGMLDAFTAMPKDKLTSIPPNSRIGVASHAAGL